MPFFGGASGEEKSRFNRASETAQAGLGRGAQWGESQRGHLSQFGNDIRQRGTERQAHLWDQLYGEGNRYDTGGGGGGGGGAGVDPGSIWGSLRDTGDLTPGDWGAARDTYEDFRTTGGFSPEDLVNLRQRALAGTDTYDPNTAASGRVQGGWGAGGGAGDLAERQGIARARNQATWGAEADISERTREGKQWGATSREGLGARVQAGRITGQQGVDAEAARRAANRRSRMAAGRADENQRWNRSMQLMGFDQSRLGQQGADLAYNQAAQQGYQGGYGVAANTMGTQQANQGWGQQLAGMAGAGGKAFAGLEQGRLARRTT